MDQSLNNGRSLTKTAETDADIIDLSAVFSTLWRGKWWISLIFLVSVFMGGYYSYFVVTPLYRSTAVVILETRESSIVDLDSVIGGMTGETSEVNSEVEVLRSRKLMGKVVSRLNLIADSEFNRALQLDGYADRVKRFFGARAAVPSVPSVPDAQAIQRRFDMTITKLLGKISIRNVPLSLVFKITVETESPVKSALIADSIVDLYILNQLEVKFEATEQATFWLTNRVTELQAELEISETKVKNFNASINLIGAETLRALERQLKDFRERNLTLSKENSSAVERLNQLVAATTQSEKVAAAANDSQLLRLMQSASSEADSRTRQDFNTRFNRIVAAADHEVSRSKNQLKTMEVSQSELEGQIAAQSQDLIVLQQLTREAEASRLLYEYFLSRLKETSAQEGIQQADSRVLSNAVVPTSAASPQKALILAMSGIVGLMLGGALVLAREAGNNTYRTARDLERATGYTVLGQIPLIPIANQKNILHYLATKPISASAEAIRNLRTSILLSNIDTPPEVILMTSALSGEGKTTNSLALAQNMASMGKSVLLIEGDIRRRGFDQYFESPNNLGLVAVLSGGANIDDVLIRDEILGADLLMSEKAEINAADLFSSDRFSEFIESMRNRYDIVIIDSPPVLIVPDARVIAQFVDTILVTVKWDSTAKLQVEDALQLFGTVNQKVTGLILSQISPRKMKHYGSNAVYNTKSGYYVN